MSLIFRLRQAINLTRKLRKIQFEDFILQNKVRNEFFLTLLAFMLLFVGHRIESKYETILAIKLFLMITGQCSDDGNIKFVAESLSRWFF